MGYVQQAKTVKISGTSKATIQIGNNYFSFSYSEERELPIEQSDVNLEEEKKLLWDTLNAEVDKQLEEVSNAYKK